MNKEKFVESHGFEKFHGWRINHEMLADPSMYEYTLTVNLEEVVKETDYWLNLEGVGFDCIDSVIDWIEDHYDIQYSPEKDREGLN